MEAILKFDGVTMPTPKFNGFKISKIKFGQGTQVEMGMEIW